jgi:carbon storage regulator
MRLTKQQSRLNFTRPNRKNPEMLVLTRKIGEQIVLPGCGVTIDVVAAGKNQVRLGIAAPAHIAVHRREVWERICPASATPTGGNVTSEEHSTCNERWQ